MAIWGKDHLCHLIKPLPHVVHWSFGSPEHTINLVPCSL